MTARCTHCGALAPAAAESCPACGSFATLLEEDAAPATATPAAMGLAVPAESIPRRRQKRVGTGFEPWDEALGGGLVVPMTLAIYGVRGCRKTTYAACIAQNVARHARGRALFLCSEMPTDMVRDTAAHGPDGAGHPIDRLLIAGNDRGAQDFAACEREVRTHRPCIVAYDSINEIAWGRETAGSDVALRGLVRSIIRLAYELRHVAILVVQVNAEGKPRCPQNVLHLTDAEVRLLRDRILVPKNRKAPTPDGPVRLRPEDPDPPPAPTARTGPASAAR